MTLMVPPAVPITTLWPAEKFTLPATSSVPPVKLTVLLAVPALPALSVHEEVPLPLGSTVTEPDKLLVAVGVKSAV